jgi:hypothetical protein
MPIWLKNKGRAEERVRKRLFSVFTVKQNALISSIVSRDIFPSQGATQIRTILEKHRLRIIILYA